MLLPFAVTPAVAAMVFKQLLNPNYGWVGYYLGYLGFRRESISWATRLRP